MRHGFVRFLLVLVLLSLYAPASVGAFPRELGTPADVVASRGSYTGTLVPPPLVEGQFVYTVPANYDPPMIGTAGLQHLSGVAKSLHFPFYVVVADKLEPMTSAQKEDARSKGYRETGAELAASYAIDRLAEDWAVLYPNTYDVSKSSIFLMEFGNRKYRMLAGSEWKKQGMGEDALIPFLDLFLAKVTGTPKDPKGGIIDLMTKYDAAVFDKVDPERVAVREAEARKKAEVARLKIARGTLDEKILTLEGLLDSDKEYLPSDTSSYGDLLNKARAVRKTDEPNEMLTFADTMPPSIKTLRDYVNEAVSKNRAKALKKAIVWLIVLGTLLILGILLTVRRRNYGLLRGQFKTACEHWQQKVKNAAGQYVAAYGDRKDIVAMDNCTGETGILWQKVTVELDDIWTAVKAIEGHVEQCAAMAAKASFFNYKALEQAILELDAEFNFDTGVINKDELFGGETKTIRVKSTDASRGLETRFKNLRAEWDTLVAASQTRLQTARELFPHTGYDHFVELAAKHSFPEAWFDDHPLAGDDTSDANVWDEADKLRWEDPVAYLKRIQHLQNDENGIGSRIHFIVVKSIEDVAKVRGVTIPALNSKVHPEQDPKATLQQAQQADYDFQGAVASLAHDKDTDTLKAKAEAVRKLCLKVENQVAAIQAAIGSANDKIGFILDRYQKVQDLGKKAYEAKEAARRVHVQGKDLDQPYNAAVDLIERARQGFIDPAKEHLKMGAHLDVLACVEQASNLLDQAEGHYKGILDQKARLDAAKAKYDDLAGKMSACYDGAVRKVTQYGGSMGNVQRYNACSLGSGVNDYTVALSALEVQVRAWDAAADRARRDYEAEQARIREEQRRREEARRAAERAAEAARESARRAAESARSSFSSGGSSSRGGSFGGGGSSSRGGGF